MTMMLDDSNFDATVAAGGLVVVDFWAPWCGPCRAFGPIFDRVAAKNTDVTFAKVNTDASPATAAQQRVLSIPTLAVYLRGRNVFVQTGVMSEFELDRLVARARTKAEGR